MLYRTATSAALLACAASAAAKPQPYRLAVMAVPGSSLARRDTFGYQPEETVCGDGNSCAEACGAGFEQCSSNDAQVHCFNPQAAQSCCTDGTGNSCEGGFYCTHDTQLQTWCCPDEMDLAECAAAYSVTGGLETPEPTTSEAPTTTSVAPTTTSTPSVTSTTPTPTSTPHSSTSCTSSVWTSANSTMTSHSSTKVETQTEVVPPPSDSPAPEPSAEPTGAASASGVSLALLAAAAGLVALF